MEPAREQRLLDHLAILMAGCSVPIMVLGMILGSYYGRYSKGSSHCKVPARLAWALQELPALVVPLLCAWAGGGHLHCWPNRILLAMFVAHYVQRSLIFPFLIRGGKPAPFAIFLSAAIFCAFNGYLQGRYLSRFAVYPDDWVTDPHFVLGGILWLTGLVINIHSDHILRNLRKPGETGYKIPRGGLFEYVSAANYFGEVVEWCGFALASCSLQACSFVFFSFCFLFSRAYHHHRWYQEKFKDYPKSRKILIPFLL